MKKYNTKPINFTGCHPVIAEALKRGEVIECRVWRDDEPAGDDVCYVVNYWHGAYVSEGMAEWDRAEPIPLKTRRIMPPGRAIPVLLAKGWKFDASGVLVGYPTNVLTIMFKLMGKPLSDPKVSAWAWPSCIIEEVEDE